MPANSIAALSRLGSLTAPTKNAFFDPQGADSMSALRAQGGGGGERDFYDLMPQEREAYLAELDAKTRAAEQSGRYSYVPESAGVEARWLPSAQADELYGRRALGGSDINLGDERLSHDAANLSTVLGMAHDTGVNKAQTEADAYWLPGQQSMRAQEQEFGLEKARASAATAGELALQRQQIASGGQVAAAQARQPTPEDRISTFLRGLVGKPKDVDRSGHPIPYTTDDITALMHTLNIGAGGAPGGAAPGGQTLTDADLQRAMQANGWTREQAVAEAQKRGYSIGQ